MNAEEIIAIANNPSTPVFRFGSSALAEWNKEHCCNGYCHTDSGWYVVLHTSPHNPDSPSFRVLSRWWYGSRSPQGVDVPTQQAA